jgi:predicted ATPase
MKTKIQSPNSATYLAHLQELNYQGIQSLVLAIPTKPSFIFLTGENGAGKTSLLRAIAKGLLGDEPKVEQLEPNAEITVSGMRNGLPFSKKAVREKYTEFNALGYGISRFRKPIDDDKKGKAYSLFHDDSTLLNIETTLMTATPVVFNKFKVLLKKIIPQLHEIQKVEDNGYYTIQYQEKSDNEVGFLPVTLEQLAAGFRGLVILVGDMIRRFNPKLDKPFEAMEGIVLIDEFDAHLHPKYQYDLPKLLVETFPKIQFIVSTHSPIPILGLPSAINYIVFKVHRTQKEGITAEQLDDEVDIRRLSANALLTSPIFGFSHIFARDATPESLIPFNNYQEVEASAKLTLIRKKIKELKLQPKF